MELKNIWAERKSLDLVLITWEISPYSANCPFQISRSANSYTHSDYNGSGRGTSFLDNINDVKDNEFLKYTVIVDDQSIETQLYLQGDPWLLSVAGDYLWQLENAAASTAAVAYCLAKDRVPCPECYSIEQRTRVKSICSVCDNSGFLLAYRGPIPFRFSPIKKSVEKTMYGNIEKEVELVQMWTGNIPILDIGDIVITKDQKKYIVQYIPHYTEMHSSNNEDIMIVRQDIVMKRLADNEYPNLTYCG